MEIPEAVRRQSEGMLLGYRWLFDRTPGNPGDRGVGRADWAPTVDEREVEDVDEQAGDGRCGTCGQHGDRPELGVGAFSMDADPVEMIEVEDDVPPEWIGKGEPPKVGRCPECGRLTVEAKPEREEAPPEEGGAS